MAVRESSSLFPCQLRRWRSIAVTADHDFTNLTLTQALTLTLALMSAVFSIQSQAALLDGFSDELVFTDLSSPVSMAVLPSTEMLVIEKGGRIVLGDVLVPQPTYNDYMILPDVDDTGERGLLSIALDPEFATNNYFYVYYHNSVVDRPRLSRFTHAEDGSSASPASEFVIWEDEVPSSNQEIPDHWGGALSFGPDGHLYLAIGDKKDSPTESQDMSLSAGKILRLNTAGAANGPQWASGGDNAHLIPADNPFIDGPGGVLDEIWALGLRNPFRGGWYDGQFYISEVGGNVDTGPDVSYEDLHRAGVADAGANFGWPMCEGPHCNGGPAPENYSPPIYSFQRSEARALVAGPLYQGEMFPDRYEGVLFLTDYARGWVRWLDFDASGQVDASVPTDGHVLADRDEFDAPVSLVEGPEGALYMTNINFRNPPGQVRRIIFDSGNQKPVITRAEADAGGQSAPPVVVAFTGEARDPEGATLSYEWDFGDGTQATGASVSHTYTEAGQYNAVLSVSDGERTTRSEPIPVAVGNSPEVQISSPVEGTLFRAGDSLEMRGGLVNNATGIGLEQMLWTTTFKHNEHSHPGGITDQPGTACGAESCRTFEVPVIGHDLSGDTAYDLTLSVTDATGLTGSDTVRILPDKVNLTLSSNLPAGAVIYTVEQEPRTGPFTIDTLIGFRHTIGAPLRVTHDGATYAFEGWSNGSTAFRQTVQVPPMDSTLTATYVPAAAGTDPGTGPGSGTGTGTRVEDGLLARYDFDEGAGVTVNDVSGQPAPLNLTVDDAASISWGEGVLNIDAPVTIASQGPATDLNTAIATSNALTLEAWLSPANNTQTGPARIISLSGGPEDRNLTLGQGGADGVAGDQYEARLRTNATDDNGLGGLLRTPPGSLTLQRTHLAYTRGADGNATLYVDGVAGTTGPVAGELLNWDVGFPLLLGNEQGGGRPWLGSFDLVALYDRALSATEVGQNHAAGSAVAPGAPLDGNSPPMAENDFAAVAPGGTGQVSVLENDTDADGDQLAIDSVVITRQGEMGEAVVNADGSLSYTHQGAEQGIDSVLYQVSDVRGGVSNVAVLTLNIGELGGAAAAPASGGGGGGGGGGVSGLWSLVCLWLFGALSKARQSALRRD